MRTELKSLLFLNDSYRKLINNRRTYASFTKQELETIFNDIKLEDINTILDPMSGYGGLMRSCLDKDISTFNLELNRPAYYWQILTNPKYSEIFKSIIISLLNKISKLPKPTKIAEASDEFFSEGGLDLALKLLKSVHKEVLKINSDEKQELAISIVLPFVFRLSTASNGDITHIKKGGISVFIDWHLDFELYLKSLLENCILPNLSKTNSKHTIVLGDARNYKFKQLFNTVITSPPFPNYRDYYKMFSTENFFLDKINGFTSDNLIIGSNEVKGKNTGLIKSVKAIEFLKKLEGYKGNKKAEKDIRNYYLAYFRQYFSDIELVVDNITDHLEEKCTCYFVVTNNATRNLIVPVAEVIEELFINRKFSANFILSSNVTHIGSKNPHVKGLKAIHTKYIIKTWRK